MEPATAPNPSPTGAIAGAVDSVFSFLESLNFGKPEPTHSGYVSPFATALAQQQIEAEKQGTTIAIIAAVAAVVIVLILAIALRRR